MNNESPPFCAQCGSARLTWRVKRNRAAGARDSHRELMWTCGDCHVSWSEALSIPVEHVAELAPAG